MNRVRNKPGSVRFLAVPPSDLEVSLEVRRQVYVAESGYPLDSIENDEFDRRAQHFVATADGAPVASMRILPAAGRPFEFERFILVPELASACSHPAEISRLCILKEYRTISRSQFILAGMWDLALDYAALSSTTEFWIWTEPSLARVYSYIGFTAVRELHFYHNVLRRTYQLMRMSINASNPLPARQPRRLRRLPT